MGSEKYIYFLLFQKSLNVLPSHVQTLAWAFKQPKLLQHIQSSLVALYIMGINDTEVKYRPLCSVFKSHKQAAEPNESVSQPAAGLPPRNRMDLIERVETSRGTQKEHRAGVKSPDRWGVDPFSTALSLGTLQCLFRPILALHLNAPLSQAFWDSNDISLALIGLHCTLDAYCFTSPFLTNRSNGDNGIKVFCFLPSLTVSHHFRHSSSSRLPIPSLYPSLHLDSSCCIS